MSTDDFHPTCEEVPDVDGSVARFARSTPTWTAAADDRPTGNRDGLSDILFSMIHHVHLLACQVLDDPEAVPVDRLDREICLSNLELRSQPLLVLDRPAERVSVPGDAGHSDNDGVPADRGPKEPQPKAGCQRTPPASREARSSSGRIMKSSSAITKPSGWTPANGFRSPRREAG
jgi:hypothetical protein